MRWPNSSCPTSLPVCTSQAVSTVCSPSRRSKPAEEMLRAAEGYAIERTNRAKGDAERFIALQKEYAAAPRVTRERLYLEAMDEIMSKTENKVFVDSKASGLLPLLNLNGKGMNQ